jgi:hypothetical protein
LERLKNKGNLEEEGDLMEEQKHSFWKALLWDLKWVLAWIGLFAVAGIVVQSLRAGIFVFLDFFGSNFKLWLSSFGNFVNPTQYSTSQELVSMIARDWYYFLYAGGLLSLIWGILSFTGRWFSRQYSPGKERTLDEFEEKFEKKEQD